MATKKPEFGRMTKLELISLIDKLNLSIKKLESSLKNLKNENIGLKLEMEAIQKQIRGNKEKRSAKRSELESQNIEYLERALSIFEDFLDRPFVPQDYMSFRRYLLKKYPQPAYIQEPRLSSEEMKQSPELQEEARELKRRTGWNEGRLRKFFKDKTGISGSTKK